MPPLTCSIGVTEDNALRGFLIMLKFLGQFLDSFRIDLSRCNRSVFRRLFVALNNLAQILFGDVASALAFVLHVLSLHA
jgi:hypothetical protein